MVGNFEVKLYNVKLYKVKIGIDKIHTRNYTGTILGLYWDYTGTILGLYWNYIGTILGTILGYDVNLVGGYPSLVIVVYPMHS